MRKWLLSILSVGLLGFPGIVRTAEPTGDDVVVQSALRAALLGNADDVRKVARIQRLGEQKEQKRTATIAENIEALAIATDRPLPTLDEKRRKLGDYGSDQMTKNLDRLLRRVEPRQRFLEAVHDARYEGFRRFFNGVISPLSAVARGQLFALFTLPFEAADELAVGSLFLTPEERRRLYLARDAANDPRGGRIAAQAQEVISYDTQRRRALAALQARQNGERAAREGGERAAIFWYEKEMQLRNWKKARRSTHKSLLSGLARGEQMRATARTIGDGDALFFSPLEFAAYSRVVRLSLLDQQNTELAAAAQAFRVDFPTSSAVDDVEAMEAARSVRRGETLLARVQLQDIATDPDSPPWSSRARQALQLPEFEPSYILHEAESRADHRFWAFMFSGSDPEIVQRSFTAEEARMRRAAWVDRARALFFTDVISRVLFLPLVDPFPRTELADAGSQVPGSFYDSPEGRPWLRKVMHAQRVEKRFEAAKKSAMQLGDADAAVAMDRRAARNLEKLGDRAVRPRESYVIYNRLLTAYPSYARRERVERKSDEAQMRSLALANVAPDELRSWPELWRDRALHINAALLDGDKSNGEIAGDGVYVMSYDAYIYQDRATGNRVEIPLTAEDHDAFLRAYEPRRRTAALAKELQKPLPRKKIPIAVEAGVFPGFDVGPALVPLTPDEAERRLYD
ncbi:hypothetical protein IT570_01315 [Candidatus Sumerlaeota bacterium]|nr:hypothetical protein [Candidatus Sumerlaeota bacterium]